MICMVPTSSKMNVGEISQQKYGRPRADQLLCVSHWITRWEHNDVTACGVIDLIQCLQIDGDIGRANLDMVATPTLPPHRLAGPWLNNAQYQSVNVQLHFPSAKLTTRVTVDILSLFNLSSSSKVVEKSYHSAACSCPTCNHGLNIILCFCTNIITKVWAKACDSSAEREASSRKTQGRKVVTTVFFFETTALRWFLGTESWLGCPTPRKCDCVAQLKSCWFPWLLT